MITFQNYVYTVIHTATMCGLGVYQNFKRAYERIEELETGITIVDCNDDKENRRFVFMVYKNGRFVGEYLIIRSLLSIEAEDILVHCDMITKTEKEYKEKMMKPNYRLRSEVM